MKYRKIDDIPLVLSVSDLAEVLGIGLNSAYDLVRSGRIKSLRVGTRSGSKSALLDFLESVKKKLTPATESIII